MIALPKQRQKAAARYLESGKVVIPVPEGSKNPNRTGWESERPGLEDVPSFWNNGQNVGLLTGEPSGWLVDVDLDLPEARKLAPAFLPETLTSGRASSPASHYWYVALGAESEDWKDGKPKLVELRSTGRQTLVAPSVHPSGEVYEWGRGSEPAEMDASELRRRCTELATAVLIARHLPDHRDFGGGGRHDYAMALSGLMLRPSRLDQDAVLKLLKAAWDVKPYPKEQDRREAHRSLEGIVRDTAENIAAGENVVGGPTLEEMEPGMVGRLRRFWGWSREQDAGGELPSSGEQAGSGDGKDERRNQSDRLIGYALADLKELFVDQVGSPHALKDGEPLALNSRCYGWLRRLMWEEEGRSVNGEALKNAAGTLAAHAEFSGNVRHLHTRAAFHAESATLYYELAPGRVVKAGAGGWGTAQEPPVLFRRYPNLKPLPDPVPAPDVDLDTLGEFVNLKADRDKRLFKAYAVTLPLPHVARPILLATGVMGSGKTTASRVLKRLWDPTAPETIRLDPRDFLQKASHAFLVMLDNQSGMPEWGADTLCKLVTGEADSKRRLYSDDEDVIFELQRAILLNGVNVPTERGDVLDRALAVELERIPDAERKSEEDLWQKFGEAHPGLLGVAFGILSEAIALKPSLELSRKPRLADWGEFAAAVYEVMGWGAETFLEDWDEVVKVQNQATLDGSPVAQAIIRFMEEKGEYTATSSELHEKLEDVAEDLGISTRRDKAWPKSARWLWRRIKEVQPLLVTTNIVAERGRDEGAKHITLRKAPKNDGSDGSRGENPLHTRESPADTGASDGISNGMTASDGMSNGSENSAKEWENADTADTANRYGESSEPVPSPPDTDGPDDDLRPHSDPGDDEPLYRIDDDGSAIF